LGFGFGWRRHFGHVAEFAEVIAVAFDGAVIPEQRAEFATGAAQIIIVHQHVIAPQRHDDINFGVVRVFRGAMEQVLVQLQQFGPLVASAGERRVLQFAQIGADPHGTEGAREIQRHVMPLGFNLQHVAVKIVVVSDAFATLLQFHLEIKERHADVNAFRKRQLARDAVNGHAFIGERDVCSEGDDNVLETLYFVGVGVVHQITELHDVRPLCGVHALAILGGKSGGFGIEDHEFHVGWLSVA